MHVFFFICIWRPTSSLQIGDDKVDVKSCSRILVVVCDGKITSRSPVMLLALVVSISSRIGLSLE